MSLAFASIRRAPDEPARLCARVGGGQAIELATLVDRVPGVPREVLDAPNLDRLLACEVAVWAELHRRLVSALSQDVPDEGRVLTSEATFCVPFTVGDYVDFYSSLEHATNVGRMFRPDAEPLLPNWRHLPVAYHGRASTLVVSGTPIRRPVGQLPTPAGPEFGPSRRLDFELELGFVIGGTANRLGEPIPIDDADQRIFGVALVNDWSARDIQAWEYQPLGPFLSKSFATSISPWVVPLAELEGHRMPGPAQEPPPLPYLRTSQPWMFDADLEVTLQPAGGQAEAITRTNARELYWNAAQQLAHAASGGAIVRPGDLLASGTISGPGPGGQGCLLELTWNGERPLQLADGRTRTFLEDGDAVTISGWAGHGQASIDLGEVSGTVIPARSG